MATPIEELKRHSLESLPERDLLFLVKAFADQRTDYERIRELVLGDVDIIGMFVESDRVFQTLMDQRTAVHNISPYLFFTLLLRRTFRDLEERPELLGSAVESANRRSPTIPWNEDRMRRLLGDRQLVSYLANMISAFSRSPRMFQVADGDEQLHYYLVDLVQHCQESDPVRRFWIYCHIGNYTLFLTGLFPEFIEHRYKVLGRPVDENYYIDFGKTYYGLASDHPLSRRSELDTVFTQLSSGFEIVKLFLNYMAQRYLRHAGSN
ncbi:MAG: hypothetical protein HYU36_11385 [Planctomycetes bacterium]|nr:hypothetical protein [Planctomycetota bacterium]